MLSVVGRMTRREIRGRGGEEVLVGVEKGIGKDRAREIAKGRVRGIIRSDARGGWAKMGWVGKGGVGLGGLRRKIYWRAGIWW